ncbi:MAG: family 78 glycoside hydrolase catalytic domain [Coriobacteriia bacterium]|nr:family 78 glycoside hydrolase catalytic domain [Coriobacteriia bacterium]
MQDISRRSFIIGAGATALSLGAVGALIRKGVAVADIKNFDAKWIWPEGAEVNGVNDYAEFVDSFTPTNTNDLKIEIACESMYALYIDDELRYFAQSSDFPQKAQYKSNEYKLYDKLDISKFCTPGKKHNLRILIWHNPGKEGCQAFLSGEAGLIYQILQGNTKLTSSGKTTQSRTLENYWHGETMRLITGQMGFSFRYDKNGTITEFHDSAVNESKSNNFNLREILPLQLDPRVDGKIVKRYEDSVLYDLGKEYVGFLDIKFKNPKAQTIVVSYGEHICADEQGHGEGHVRRQVGGRDFSVDIKSNAGETVEYLNPFRRLGCRYLEISALKIDEKSKGDLPTEIDYIGIRPVMYPLEDKPYNFKNATMNKIYEACIWTLKCCMHEHYEDCPWREQCLYGMDSRNQMLCGYYAFEGHEYQRHNLILLAQSLREDNMIEICAPCNNNYPIPMFSYAFIIGAAEYIKYTKDKSILDHIKPAIDAIFTKSKAMMGANHYIPKFPHPFWNFIEWWNGSDSDSGILNLNNIFIIAHEKFKSATGISYLTEEELNNMRKTLDDKLYVSSKGEYCLDLEDRLKDLSSQLGNATAILAKLPNANENLANKILKDMQGESTGMVTASLSMRGFLYDALLEFNDPKYKKAVYDDILKNYTTMMDSGYFTGTFWEDERGQHAFSDAGSLCHGWSAIPIYYFNEYYS